MSTAPCAQGAENAAGMALKKAPHEVWVDCKLFVGIAKLPRQGIGENPGTEYLVKLQAIYLRVSRKLTGYVVAPSLGKICLAAISNPDRERAFQALKLATLFDLRREVRNVSVLIEHSLSFRCRARLFFTEVCWIASTLNALSKNSQYQTEFQAQCAAQFIDVCHCAITVLP